MKTNWELRDETIEFIIDVIVGTGELYKYLDFSSLYIGIGDNTEYNIETVIRYLDKLDLYTLSKRQCNGLTLLETAVFYHHPIIVNKLLSLGVTQTTTIVNGKLCHLLDLAIISGHKVRCYCIITTLIRFGVNRINTELFHNRCRSTYLFTLIHIAVTLLIDRWNVYNRAIS